MKHLKLFENFDNVVQDDFISETELKEQLSAALKLDDFEAATKLIRSIKDEYPYVKTTEPYKEIYEIYLKMWRDKFKYELETYKPED